MRWLLWNCCCSSIEFIILVCIVFNEKEIIKFDILQLGVLFSYFQTKLEYYEYFFHKAVNYMQVPDLWKHYLPLPFAKEKTLKSNFKSL